MGDAGGRLCQHSTFRSQADHCRQCRQTAGRLDFLDRRVAWSRRRPAGDRRHDVPAYAVPEYGLCAESERRKQDRLEVRTEAGLERHSGDVLRHRQPRRGLRRRQDFLASSGHDIGRTRRQDRQGCVVGEERRSRQGRDRHLGAARVQGQGHHWNFGRRVRRSRFGDRLQHQGRQAGMARLFDGPGQRHSDRPTEDHASRQAGRTELRHQYLAGRAMEDRRRHHVGLVFVRSRAEPDVLWVGQPLDLEPQATSR